MNLRSWIRRVPVPVKVRVETNDGVKEVAVATSGGRRIANAADAIIALEPNGRIEAIDEKGVVVRVQRIEGEQREEEQDDKDDKDDMSDERRWERMTARVLTHFATLLADGADKAAQRHSAAYELAFTKNNELLTIVAVRLVGMEKAWQQAMNKLGQAAAGEDDPMDVMLKMAAMKLAGGGGLGDLMPQMSRPNKGKTNGKHTPSTKTPPASTATTASEPEPEAKE